MAKFNPSDYPKFRKQHKGYGGKIVGLCTEKNSELAFCNYGLKAVTAGKVTPSQLEAIRQMIVKGLGKEYLVRFRIFAHTPRTKKPLAVRMGGGVGAVEDWIAIVKPGQIIVEVDGPNNDLICQVLNTLSNKLSCLTKVVCRHGFQGGSIC